MATEIADTEDSDDEVLRGCGCPNCGEQRIDWLAIDEDGETVTCSTCGRHYVCP